MVKVKFYYLPTIWESFGLIEKPEFVNEYYNPIDHEYKLDLLPNVGDKINAVEHYFTVHSRYFNLESEDWTIFLTR